MKFFRKSPKIITRIEEPAPLTWEESSGLISIDFERVAKMNADSKRESIVPMDWDTRF